MNNHSSVHALPPGTLLQNGKYRIIRFISAGGFGCTYEAIHTLFDERVAIKELFVGDFCNRDALTGHVTVATLSKQPLVAKLHRKFIDEAKAQRHLNHAGIVRVTDVFEENSTAYYVMDYIDGRSLHEFPGRMPEAAAVAYIRQVAAAMAYVHSTGRLHLDIKPGNIMIDQHGRAILIDFGTSKQYDEANGQNTSTLLGLTPGFASPEQMSGQIKAFTPAADIYSLGATLYRLLSGVTPPDVALRFSGTSVQPLPATISAATRRAVESAMQLDIRLRPASMNAFIAMLDGVDDATIPASGPTPAPAHKYASTHTPAPGPRKTSRTTYIAIAATALIAGAILFFLLRGKGDEREAVAAHLDTTAMARQEIPTPEPIVPEGMVDLGLSVYWADKCVDNAKPVPKSSLVRQLDASHRLPTKAEWQELMDHCTWTWQSSPAGYRITAPNGNSIFLPAAGAYNPISNELLLKNDYGAYWAVDENCVLAFSHSDNEIGVGEPPKRYVFSSITVSEK